MANTVRDPNVILLLAHKLALEAVGRILENRCKCSNAHVISVYAILQELHHKSAFNHATFGVILSALLSVLEQSRVRFEGNHPRANKNCFLQTRRCTEDEGISREGICKCMICPFHWSR